MQAVFYFYLALAGFGGGVMRGLVGFLKHQFSYKNVPFNLKYFLATSFLSGIVGLLSSTAVKEIGLTLAGSFTVALSFLVGYAGGDFLEGLYKIILQKSKLPELNEKK